MKYIKDNFNSLFTDSHWYKGKHVKDKRENKMI